MPRRSRKAKLILTPEKKEELQRIANSRKAPLREVERANILLRYSENSSILFFIFIFQYVYVIIKSSTFQEKKFAGLLQK
jgi:hypothetical protein